MERIIINGDLIVTGCYSQNQFAELKKNGVTVTSEFGCKYGEIDIIIPYKVLASMRDTNIYVKGIVYCHKY
nr:MAG TPA: UPF0102 protein [Caudoviricetes sp.]